MKRCTKCGEVKPLSEYHRDKRAKGGRNSQCRVCRCAQRVEWAKRNPDKAAKGVRLWRERHPERSAAANSKSERAWRLKNPAAANEKTQRRRARRNGNGVYTIASKDARRLEGQGCQHAHLGGCSGSLELDHLVPISRGGRHSIGNLQMLCRHHNRSKNNRLEIEVRSTTYEEEE